MKKKRLFFLCFIALLSQCLNNVNAQSIKDLANILSMVRDMEDKKPIGECTLEVTYDYRFQLDTISGKKFHDRYVLQLGPAVSRFFSFNSEICDSIMYKAGLAGKDAANTTSWMEDDEFACYEDVFGNYPAKGQMTVSAKIFMTEFYYEEAIPEMAWEICEESAEILGYECCKATTSFRGRDWTAWFATGLPFSSGPWKFNGLPGLILRLTDGDGLFTYEAIGIQRMNGLPIYIHDGKNEKRVKLKRSDYLSMQRKKWQDPMSLVISQGSRVVTIDSKTGQTSEGKEGGWQFPYCPPLELE